MKYIVKRYEVTAFTYGIECEDEKTALELSRSGLVEHTEIEYLGEMNGLVNLEPDVEELEPDVECIDED